MNSTMADPAAPSIPGLQFAFEILAEVNAPLSAGPGANGERKHIVITGGTRADEIGNFAVRVASHILQGSLAVGSFIQPLYGHDGEHLVDSPGIGQ